MESAKGIAIVEGIAIGKIHVYKRETYHISETGVKDEILEWTRFEEALEKVRQLQRVLYAKTVEAMGQESAEIFEAREFLLYDEILLTICRKLVLEQKASAEYAVSEGFDRAAESLLATEDDYIRERAADIQDLKQTMLEELLEDKHRDVRPEEDTQEPVILVAEDLTPSETVKLDQQKLLGLITREGSMQSHTAILARSMNLPALVQCKEIADDWDGKYAILDGYHSCIYIEPTQDLIDSLTARHHEELEKQALLQELKGKASATIDGRTIKICANIGGPSDIGAVQNNDAEGVGLFRSEFVYLNSREDPSEEEQFEVYKRVVETLSPKQVIIRTCDIGADKTIDYMKLDKEENPALGYRAIRICLTRKDFFKRQLRALLRASAFGNLGIMFPMITSLREVRECKEILAECKRELANEGVKVGEIQVGIMIETPAAALCADELAEEVDFFSLGTNDLTQYTCAIDRQNARLEPFADLHHPAVLKLIRMTIEAGHRHHIWVGICGELAADDTLTEDFLRMGVDELSVNPGSILPLRRKIRSIDLSKSAEK